jgi:hypothetical protein
MQRTSSSAAGFSAVPPGTPASQSADSSGVAPELDRQNVTGEVPWRRQCQCGRPQRRTRESKPFNISNSLAERWPIRCGILASNLAGKDAWSLASTCWDLVVSALPCRANGGPNSTLTSGGSRIAATCGAALRCGIRGAIVNELAAPYFSLSFLFTEQSRHFPLVLALPLSGKRCRLSPCALRRTTMRTFACAVDSLSTIGPDLAAPYKHNSPGVCNFEGMDADPDQTILASIRMKSEQQDGIRTIADRFSQTQDKVGVLH